jgi:hypothetical protein
LNKTTERFWVLKQPNKGHDKVMILKPRRRNKKLECHGRKYHEGKTSGSIMYGLVYAHECALLENFRIHDAKKNPDKGCPDLLSERDVDGDDGDEDNSSVAENSSPNPCCQCNSSQPFGYSQRHTLAHVAADHEAVMQYTNSQWNNRLHSDFQ